MGANLVTGGATFRVWGGNAKAIYVVRRDFDMNSPGHWTKNDPDLLVPIGDQHWAGFFPGVKEGDEYRFWVVGDNAEGFKRDPYARELSFTGWPENNCIVCKAESYPWHDRGFRPPGFNDLLLYQLHIGVFYAVDAAGNDIRKGRVSKFLDVLTRVKYLADLGINAVMPLPIAEFQTPSSRGYNGTDIFSPEMDYAVQAAELPRYLTLVNQLLAEKNQSALQPAQLAGQANQLKAMIDIFHLYGIAVILDVVYNHAGPGFNEESIEYFDLPANRSDDNRLYFVRDEEAGGKVFRYADAHVRQFLIDNAKFFLNEYHVDGFRYDQVTVIDRKGGWFFCQDLTATVKFQKPEAIHIAEYWGEMPQLAVLPPPAGMGFDAGYSDRLRDAIREVIAESTGGASSSVNFGRVRDALYPPPNYPNAWRAFQCIENHDLLDDNHTGNDKRLRIPALADYDHPRSWFACSRSRVATGLLLTAPGIPMLFMGQEFLENKYWKDDPNASNLFIWWEGLEGKDKDMSDHHRFTRDLLWLRRKHPALRGEGINVFHCPPGGKVIGFHRWLPGIGRDVVIVASLYENTFYNYGYRLGFPLGGHWQEVFNSDIYQRWYNPNPQGNPGGIDATDPGMDNLPCSAGITLPANGLLVFARDGGDF